MVTRVLCEFAGTKSESALAFFLLYCYFLRQKENYIYIYIYLFSAGPMHCTISFVVRSFAVIVAAMINQLSLLWIRMDALPLHTKVSLFFLFVIVSSAADCRSGTGLPHFFVCHCS